MKVHFIRVALLALMAALHAGCAEMHGYNSPVSGPKATILFVSPYLENRFMSVDRLALFVLEPDEQCQFTSVGNIPLSDNKKGAPTVVTAGRRMYLRLWQNNHGFMSSSSNHRREFSFIPEKGMEYIIEHIDNPASLRAKYYRQDPNNKRQPLDVQGTEVCKVKK